MENTENKEIKNVRDCEHCKNYVWNEKGEYQSCSKWSCKFESEDEGDGK